MIKIEKVETMGWEQAIRGMRNPMNSWDKSDSVFENYYIDDRDCEVYYHYIDSRIGHCNVYATEEWGCPHFNIGENDLTLMKRLVAGGSVHAKFRRMIVVYADITAPLYWWKEFDTYKVGTVANSCSTMHKIHDKEFERDDFSHEQMDDIARSNLDNVISRLNICRDIYNVDHANKASWYHMIQLLPSSYNQKRTVMMNYEVLSNIYHQRRNHKLKEWCYFCGYMERLPYAEELIMS